MSENDTLCLTKALEKWIALELKRNNSDKPYLISMGGKSYTLTQILEEVKNETEFGNKIKISLIKMTIDLLLRNKEVL